MHIVLCVTHVWTHCHEECLLANVSSVTATFIYRYGNVYVNKDN